MIRTCVFGNKTPAGDQSNRARRVGQSFGSQGCPRGACLRHTRASSIPRCGKGQVSPVALAAAGRLHRPGCGCGRARRAGRAQARCTAVTQAPGAQLPFLPRPSAGRDPDIAHSAYRHLFPKTALPSAVASRSRLCQALGQSSWPEPTPARLSRWVLVRQCEGSSGLRNNLGPGSPGKTAASPARPQPSAPEGEQNKAGGVANMFYFLPMNNRKPHPNFTPHSHFMLKNKHTPPTKKRKRKEKWLLLLRVVLASTWPRHVIKLLILVFYRIKFIAAAEACVTCQSNSLPCQVTQAEELLSATGYPAYLSLPCTCGSFSPSLCKATSCIHF